MGSLLKEPPKPLEPSVQSLRSLTSTRSLSAALEPWPATVRARPGRDRAGRVEGSGFWGLGSGFRAFLDLFRAWRLGV